MHFDRSDGVDGLNHAGHLVAGAAAGAAEHVFMFPVDTVKTRMQVVLVGRALQISLFTYPFDFSRFLDQPSQ
jgi:hypothetical protein